MLQIWNCISSWKYRLVILSTLICCHQPYALATNDTTLYSIIVKDSFSLKITLPDHYDSLKACKLFFYTDATQHLGLLVRRMYENKGYPSFSSEYILVGIGHTGKRRPKRRRDFIPPKIGESVNGAGRGDSQFTRADMFKAAILKEILPWVYNQFNVRHDSTVYCGHSFGGLFGLYLMTDPEVPFSEYLLQSPSIWANNKSVLDHIDRMMDSTENIRLTSLNIYVGGLELFNRILFNSFRLQRYLDRIQVRNLDHSLRVFPLVGHRGIMNKSLRDFLSELETK